MSSDPTFEDIIEWIRDDREIEEPRHDWFGHRDVARRIVRQLTDTNGERPTMVVIGPYGSGKSSIRSLVNHHLESHPTVEMADISLWPFDSVNAATNGILQRLIEALGRHVNTLALTGLPEQYITTVEQTGGFWGGIAHCLQGPFPPEDVVRQLSRIAAATGIHIVLWIEDIERFTGYRRVSSAADPALAHGISIREIERLGPITSLLHLLDRCDCISVVIADVSLRLRIDVEKFARFVEQLPALTPMDVWSKLRTFRNGCMNRDFIDPRTDEYRKALSAPPGDDFNLQMWLWAANEDKPRAQEAVGLLLNTPRLLKSALRLTWNVWDNLCGEIDFDSVLLASTLRVTRTEVLDLLITHIDSFRRGYPQKPQNFGGEPAGQELEKSLNDLLQTEESTRLRNAIMAAIKYIFPRVNTSVENTDQFVSCPQGLFVERHVNYWHRYLAVPDISEAESDQAALRDIAAWKANEPNTVVDRLLDHRGYPDQLMCFVGQFTGQELARLLEEASYALLRSSRDWTIRVTRPD